MTNAPVPAGNDQDEGNDDAGQESDWKDEDDSGDEDDKDDKKDEVEEVKPYTHTVTLPYIGTTFKDDIEGNIWISDSQGNEWFIDKKLENNWYSYAVNDFSKHFFSLSDSGNGGSNFTGTDL